VKLQKPKEYIDLERKGKKLVGFNEKAKEEEKEDLKARE